MVPNQRGASGSPQYGVRFKDGWVGVPLPGIPQQVDVLIAEVGGVLQIVGLRIDPTYVWAGKGSDGSPVMSEPLIRPTQDGEHLAWAGPKHIDPTITADLLRRLPLRQLRAAAVGALNDDGGWLEPFKIEKAGRSWPADHYEEVARVYRNAGHAPLKAIQETWHVSRPAASKWVRRARDLGYLRSPIKAQRSGQS